MTNLTEERFVEAVRQLYGERSAGIPPPFPSLLPGIRIVQADVPPVRYPYCRITLAHPWIVWLARYFKISPWVWIDDEVEVPVVYHDGRIFYVSAGIFNALRRSDTILTHDCTS